MSNWYVGQKIVCINTGPVEVRNPLVEKYLKEGEIYTIREIVIWKYWTDPKGLGFRLQEVKFEPMEHFCDTMGWQTFSKEYPFWSGRFKPLEEKQIDISIFTNILKEVNERNLVPV